MPMRRLLRLLVIGVSLGVGTTTLGAQPADPIATYGRGVPVDVVWNPHSDELLVVTRTDGLWRYDAHSLETIEHVAGVKQAYYSASGRWVLTQNVDDTWAIRRADRLAEVVEDGFIPVLSVPGEKWLVTRSETGIAIRLETNPRRILLDGLQAVHVSPDGRQVLTRDAVNGFVLRDARLAPVDDAPTLLNEVTGVYWSPDGQRIAMVTGGDQITMVPLAAGAPTSVLTMPDRRRFNRLAWSPDSTRLLDADDVGNARIWDAVTGRLLLYLSSGKAYRTPEEIDKDERYWMNGYTYWRIRWSSDGTHLLRCYSGGDTFMQCTFLSARTGAKVSSVVGESFGLALTPDERYLVLSSGIYDTNTGTLVEDFRGTGQGGLDRTFSASGQRMAATSGAHDAITIYNFAEKAVEHTLNPAPFLYDVYTVRMTPDGTHLVTVGRAGANYSSGSGLITVWDVATGQEVGHIEEHILLGQEMAFSTDGAHLAATDNLGNVAIIETATGALLRTIDAHDERISTLAWQPGGNLLATTTARHLSFSYYPGPQPADSAIVHVWDARTGDLVRTLGHEQTVVALLWHPSGQLLVTDDMTGTSLWDAQTWARQHVPQMSGGSGFPAPNYQWTGDDMVLTRGHRECSGGSGNTLNFFNISTRRVLGPLQCFGWSGYVNDAWNNAIGGMPVLSQDCTGYVPGSGGKNCTLDVAIVAEERPNTFYAEAVWFGERFPTDYTLGRYDFSVVVSHSPSNTHVAVLTHAALQMWQLGRDSAELLWTAEPTRRVLRQLNRDSFAVMWSHSGDEVAVVRGNTVQVIVVGTGATRTVLQSLPTTKSYELLWSDDDAALVVRGNVGWGAVVDAATGQPLPLPDGLEPLGWRSGYLVVRDYANDTHLWWDVRAGQMVAANESAWMTVSDDRRFGAETRAGVLRLWQLAE